MESRLTLPKKVSVRNLKQEPSQPKCGTENKEMVASGSEGQIPGYNPVIRKVSSRLLPRLCHDKTEDKMGVLGVRCGGPVVRPL